jgi:hypothetical protein
VYGCQALDLIVTINPAFGNGDLQLSVPCFGFNQEYLVYANEKAVVAYD